MVASDSEEDHEAPKASQRILSVSGPVTPKKSNAIAKTQLTLNAEQFMRRATLTEKAASFTKAKLALIRYSDWNHVKELTDGKYVPIMKNNGIV
jgi:hypothetical protein